jgi:hypothetical protein
MFPQTIVVSVQPTPKGSKPFALAPVRNCGILYDADNDAVTRIF